MYGPNSEVGCCVVMSKPDITRQPHWLNKSRMATSLGISTQAFDKWGVEPVARIGREAFYDVRSVLENRLDFAERKHQPDGDVPEGIDPLAEHKLTQERLRLTSAQADAQEKKNLVADKHLVPTEFAVFALGKIAAQIGSIRHGALEVAPQAPGPRRATRRGAAARDRSGAQPRFRVGRSTPGYAG